MKIKVVVDTSVVFKWFKRTEIDHLKAKALLNQHLLEEIEIIVPDLLIYEVANAWSTKSDLSKWKLNRNFKLLESYLSRPILIEFKLIKKAANFSRKYKVSVYDAIYAVLAKERKCDLITADHKFADKVNLTFIKKLSETGFEI